MSPDTLAKKVIYRVLKETKDAYQVSCETDHVDADYAEYASLQSINEFRRAFGNPELTYEQLSRILRKASNKERQRQCKTPWAVFMANYLERVGNSNIQSQH